MVEPYYSPRVAPLLHTSPGQEAISCLPLYSKRHLLLFLPRRACSAALVAISNTSLTPSFVFAEHSMYPKAQILFAMSRPSSGFTGSFQWEVACQQNKKKETAKCFPIFTCFILASSLRVCSSLRRSFLFPTRIIGTLGQKCLTSGVHFSGMFSEERRRRREHERQWTLQTAGEKRIEPQSGGICLCLQPPVFS